MVRRRWIVAAEAPWFSPVLRLTCSLGYRSFGLPAPVTPDVRRGRPQDDIGALEAEWTSNAQSFSLFLCVSA